jgi:hypothetical protein
MEKVSRPQHPLLYVIITLVCIQTGLKTDIRGETGGAIMKNEMPSLLVDEKLCFIRLPPDTLQNF